MNPGPGLANSGGQKRLKYLLLSAAYLGIVLLYLLHVYYYQLRADHDDPYISFRYAYNLLGGHGLVWNPGEHWQGYSNFLWVIVSALVYLFAGDFMVGARVISLLSFCAVCWGAYWHLRTHHGRDRARNWTPVVGFLTACNFSYACFAANGWEFAFYSALLVGAIAKYEREVRAGKLTPVSLILWLAVILTRSEAPVMLIAPAAYRAFERLKGRRITRGDIAWWVSLTLLTGFYVLFQWLYFGTLRTGPYLAKISEMAGSGLGQQYLLAIFVYSAPLYVPLLLFFGGMMWKWHPGSLLLWTIPAILQCIIIYWADGDHIFANFRLFAAFFPLTYVILVSGGVEFTRRISPRNRRVALLLSILSFLCFGLQQLSIRNVNSPYLKTKGSWAKRYFSALMQIRYKNSLSEVRPVISRSTETALNPLALRFILDNTRKGEPIVFPEIGFVGLASDCILYDQRGLTDPDAAWCQYYERKDDPGLAEKYARRFVTKIKAANPPFITIAKQNTFPGRANDELANSDFLKWNYKMVDENTLHQFYIRRDRLSDPLPAEVTFDRWYAVSHRLWRYVFF
jgi:hypothetical protein